MLKEQQIKLGYQSETVRLYYPLSSLNHLLLSELDEQQMQKELERFSGAVRERFGEIEISHRKDRFCFAIPPQGSDYVHEHMDSTEFICQFIRAIGRHGCTIEDVIQVFHDYSQHVHVESMENGEFDYMIYFEDGSPDHFRYCIKDEGHHLIYHRFTPEDYEDFGFL